MPRSLLRITSTTCVVDALVRDLDLAGDDGGGAADAVRERVLAVEHRRVQEGREQRDLLRVARAVGERDGLVDHRVADAVHGARELFRDAGIDVRIVAGEAVRRAGDGAGHRLGELGEHDALVFGRLDDLRGLEDLFVAPFRVQRLDPLGLEIVLAVPDRVDRGERDVLVGAVVAGDVIGKQVLQAEIRVGRAVLADRRGDSIVLVAEQDQMRGAEIVEVDEAARAT